MGRKRRRKGRERKGEEREESGEGNGGKVKPPSKNSG